MISINDIKISIIKLLRENTSIENITGEDCRQSLFPLLHVQLKPVSSNTFSLTHDSILVKKSILIDIAYMEEAFTNNAKIYEMLEKIDSIMRPFIRVSDRAFEVSGSYNIIDDIGHYIFTLNFTDEVPIEVREPIVTDIELKMN